MLLNTQVAVDTPISRVLLLTPRLALGGEERFNLTLLEQLLQHNVVISVCVTANGPHPWQSDFARYTSDIFILSNFLTPDDFAHFLVNLIRSRQISIVLVVSSLLGYGLLPYLRAHCPNVAFVDYIHMVDMTWRDGGYARVSANTQRWLDLTITSSAYARDWLVAHGAGAACIEVCTTNIDSQVWDPARHDRAGLSRFLNLPTSSPVILYAARLDVQKRPALLVEVLTELRQRGLSFTCLIAGDGPQRQWLLREVRHRSLNDSVHWLGAVAPDRLPELMAASDVFCLPSANEGIALTLYEAMSMALPVVAAQVGGQHELVTPETGYLIPCGPEEARTYADHLAVLLTSPEQRRAMGRAARKRIVAQFSIDQMTQRMLVLLAQAQTLAQTSPRSAPSPAEAGLIAQQWLVLHRQGALSEHLFAGPPEAIDRGRVRQRVARWVKNRWLRPLYFWGLAHGLDWLVPLKLSFRHLTRQQAQED